MSTETKFSLEQVQRWMQDILVYPEKSVGKNVRVEELVNASKNLSAQRHLNIYMQSYIARLRECMKNQFSALAFALGDELFQNFADEYLSSHPSKSYTLNALGEKLPDFLEATRPDANEEIKESWPDFMIELARFEFSLSVIFDQVAEETNETIPVDAKDDELKLISVFHLFHHHYPICNYYLEYSAKKEPPLPFPEETYCVVIRKNYRLGLFPVNASQFAFLSLLKEGKTIAESWIVVSEKSSFTSQQQNELWQAWRKHFLANGFFLVSS